MFTDASVDGSLLFVPPRRHETFGSLHGVCNRLIRSLRPLANNFYRSQAREIERPAENAGDLVKCSSRILLDLVGTKEPGLSVFIPANLSGASKSVTSAMVRISWGNPITLTLIVDFHGCIWFLLPPLDLCSETPV